MQISCVAPFSALRQQSLLRISGLSIIKSLLFFAVCFYILPVFAQTNPPITVPLTNVTTNGAPAGFSAQTMLVNIAQQLPNLTRMVTAIAYVLGMFFILRGIIKLKHFGESRTQMSHEHGLSAPLISLAVGTLLLYLPTAVQVGLSTFWTNPSPYSYLQQQDQWSQIMDICFQVVQFIGVIAFIRGLIILSHVGGQGGQQGSLGKGLMHIVGGIFCINIYQFVQVIMNTIGI